MQFLIVKKVVYIFTTGLLRVNEIQEYNLQLICVAGLVS